MADTSTTTEAWIERVEAWRVSGERAEEFSRSRGFAASTLRWWASKLKRDLAPPAPPPPATDEVRLARVVRVEPSAVSGSTTERPGPAIVLDVLHAGVRVAVEAGADRATLALVLDVLGVGAAR